MSTVLHTESSPGLGGQEIRTLNEARWTIERGWRVILACPAAGRLYGCAREAGLPVIPVPMTRAWDARAILRLRRLIRDEHVSLVHTHSSVDAWVGGLAARAAGVPVVRSRHVSIPIHRRINPVYSWLADRVITSGEAIRRLVIAAGVPPERVVAIPAGVSLSDFPFRARSELRTETLGLSSPVIGSVAMFRGSKGHAHLLDALGLVRARHPRASLLLVGDGVRRQWVEGLAREAGLGQAVVFAGFRADVPALLRLMDCFVLASTRTEGVPQSLLQAFASGVPVVATDVGGVSEVVTDGVTGLLVTPGSGSELSRAIEAVLADPATAVQRATAARKLVEERFSHQASMTRLLDVYSELLSASAFAVLPS